MSESHQTPRKRNVSELKPEMEQEDLCGTHGTTDPCSAASHVSISDSSVQKPSDNPSPVFSEIKISAEYPRERKGFASDRTSGEIQ